MRANTYKIFRSSSNSLAFSKKKLNRSIVLFNWYTLDLEFFMDSYSKRQVADDLLPAGKSLRGRRNGKMLQSWLLNS